MNIKMVYDSRPETYEHIAVVQNLLHRVVKELLDRADAHDRSKLSSPELEVFDEMTPRLRELTFGSEEYKECLHEMGPALQHHYRENSGHHAEGNPRGIRGMTLIDLIEMAMDWSAAVRRHDDGDILKSVEINQDRYRFSDELRDVLINTYREMGLM